MEAELNRRSTFVVPLLALTVLLSGCDLVKGILKFGFWSGVIIVLVIIAIIWFVARLFGR